MPGWVGSLGASQIENWDICVREGLFASGANASGGVRRGDDVFIWLAPDGFKARCLATADAARVEPTTRLPWPPKADGSYHAFFPIEVVAELPGTVDRKWEQIKTLTGITASPQFFPRVPAGGVAALIDLFASHTPPRVDYSFLPGPDVEFLQQDQRHLANRSIAYRRGRSLPRFPGHLI